MNKELSRLADVKVGDVVLDNRPQTVRILRTTKYRCVGTVVVRGTIIEAPSASNGFRALVQFPEGPRTRDGQYIWIEKL